MIDVERKALLAAMNFAGAAIERRNSIPILDAMRVHANGALHLSGTDLDMEARASVPFTGNSAEPFVFEDHRAVSHALRHGGGDGVGIEPRDGKAPAITSGRLSIEEAGELVAGDWPLLGKVSAARFTATISREHLRDILRVMTAVSTEETRYYLNGVFLHHLDGWNYRAVATDGHRLMCVDLALPDATGDLGGGIIIPRRAMNVLATHFAKAESIALTCGQSLPTNVPPLTMEQINLSRIGFAAEVGGIQLRLLAKTIDGKYPDYARILPLAGAGSTIVAHPGAIRSAVQALATPGQRTPALRFETSVGTLKISSAIGVGINAAIEVDCETTFPAGFSVSFNGRYLLDVLSAIRGDQVVIATVDTASPAVIRDPADTVLTGLLMPMRV